MNQRIDHALLFGATGLIGGLLLDEMLANPGIGRITAITRRPLPRRDPRLANPVSELRDPASFPATGPASVAFCCLGTTIGQAGGKAGFRAVDHDLVLHSANLARREGVRHFLLVSAVGASVSSPVFYNRVKGETERDLAAIGFMRLSIAQPSLLLGERGGARRPGEAFAAQLFPRVQWLLAGPLTVFTPIQAKDVASALLACAFAAAGTAAEAPRVERLRWKELMELARRSH